MKLISGSKIVRKFNKKVYTIQNVYEENDGSKTYLIVRHSSPTNPHGTWETSDNIRIACDFEISSGVALEF